MDNSFRIYRIRFTKITLSGPRILEKSQNLKILLTSVMIHYCHTHQYSIEVNGILVLMTTVIMEWSLSNVVIMTPYLGLWDYRTRGLYIKVPRRSRGPLYIDRGSYNPIIPGKGSLLLLVN